MKAVSSLKFVKNVIQMMSTKRKEKHARKKTATNAEFTGHSRTATFVLIATKTHTKGETKMDKVNLSAPWFTFVNELKALFEKDPDITISFSDNDEHVVRIFVEDWRKADALAKLLPTEKVFGNVTLNIEVIPANDPDESIAALFSRAFEGNPVMRSVQIARPVLGGTFTYVMFKKAVAQFYNDQLDDINGNKSMLYQDIAKDVFGAKDGTFYCTDYEE